ncbi:Resistance to glucose repression protein [Lachnellula hyalina]|uniref:Resistance to glucose repression protein n=1 Tax=Lachnellula hyalina TaxID=1316788 RepID=A0A8H8R406_9HELO|nr:Resistance to glucose repression protein [Lachnellula hyalina]TVY28038.1 Resistance to glucose repression protein [Lachnellula hyalina]
MDDSRPGPEDVHFEWEDIIEYKTFSTPKHGKSPIPNRHLSFSEYSRADLNLIDSDVDASQSSETESNVSTGRSSSVAGSHSTRTTFSLGGVDDLPGDEEQIDFPSYDDTNSGLRVSGSCDDFHSFPAISPTGDSNSPDLIERAEDDVAVVAIPSRHVDYLSHDWCEEDIWSSWKHLRSKRSDYSKKERLENAAWRIWGKARQNLVTIKPDTISWNKDRDVTWLYGPLQTIANESDLCYTSGATVSTIHQVLPLNIKPILKKRTLYETLLQRSISSSSLDKQPESTAFRPHDDYLEPNQNDPTRNSVRYASTTRINSVQNLSTAGKNVRFHERVEQYIALEKGDHEEPGNENELEDCLTMYYSQTQQANVRLYNKASSLLDKSAQDPPSPMKTIATLPTTTLNDPKATETPPRPANKSTCWTPSSYVYDTSIGTVCTVESDSIRAVHDDSDEEDWLECFAPRDDYYATSDMTSGGELTSRDVSTYDQVRAHEVAQARSSSERNARSKQDTDNPDDFLHSHNIAPSGITAVLEEEAASEDTSISEKGSTGTDSDVDSDTQSTSEDCSVESDEPSNGSLRDLDVERLSDKNDMGSILNPIKEDLVDRVMDEFWILFNHQEWDCNITTCNNTSPSSTPTSITTSSSSAPSKQAERKRQRIDDDEGAEDNEERRSRQPRRSSAPKEGDETRFACPFRKHNSRQYNIYNNRVCALNNWRSIARVKEHLYRCHQVSPHCKRCWRTFKTQQQLDSHITVAAGDICHVQPGNPPTGITPVIERQLRSRKKSHPNQNDGDRWRDIYKLLFPNEEIPSPYFEAVKTETPSSPDSRELANYEEYIRRELPRLVRSNIEEVVHRETQPLEASLIGSLVGIIQDCQDRVFRAYRERQGVDPDMVTQAISPASNNMSRSLPRVTWAEDWAAYSLPLQSNFLDAAFEAPLRTEQPALDLSRLGQAEQPRRDIFSDSGYASEPRCSCQGSCTCLNSGLDTRIQDGISGTPTNRFGLSDSNAYPSWHQLESTEDEADWWMNI